MSLVKAIIGLFLGLVIQLSQIQGCVLMEDASPPCGTGAEHSCCEGFTSCPCAENGEENEKAPAPIAPGTVDLKLLAPTFRELNRLFDIIPDMPETRPAFVSFVESPRGYVGVPLSVAFCSFVI